VSGFFVFSSTIYELSSGNPALELGAPAAGDHHPSGFSVRDLRLELAVAAVLKVEGIEVGSGGCRKILASTSVCGK
jgi:hypothetical protein